MSYSMLHCMQNIWRRLGYFILLLIACHGYIDIDMAIISGRPIDYYIMTN